MQQFIAQQIPQPDEIYRAVQGALNLQLVQTGLGLTLGVFGALSQVALVLVLSIYWSIDRDRFERLWLSMLQAERRIRARTIWQGIEDGVGAYLRSTALQFVASGLLLALGYRLLGLDAPVTLALLAAVVGLIPLLGWALAIVPAMLVGLIGGPVVAALAALYTLACCCSSKGWWRPACSTTGATTPMLTVLVMLALTDVLGILGLLLAVPLAAVIQIVLSEFSDPICRDVRRFAAQSAPAGAPGGEHGRRRRRGAGRRWTVVADSAKHGRAPEAVERRSQEYAAIAIGSPARRVVRWSGWLTADPPS